MKKIFYSCFILITSILAAFCSYKFLTGTREIVGIFISGVCFGIFIMFLKLNVKNDKINIYKRELEKESISSDNNLAKVKVLESKIEVLEKALQNALNK